MTIFVIEPFCPLKKNIHAIRAAIQRSKATIKELNEEYDSNPKTVIKWANRSSFENMLIEPKGNHLDGFERNGGSALYCISQTHAPTFGRLPLCLQTTVPQLPRSLLHRLSQRQDLSRVPKISGNKPKKRFMDFPIGYFYADCADLRTAKGIG